ncbi:MAG: flagellar protein FlaG [Nitrospina sp.]|nr:flagellar protein FlaG [Nitrospina sp.]
MSFAISSAVFNTGTTPREAVTAGGRSASPAGETGAVSPTPFSEPHDVVTTSQAGQQASDNGGSFFEQSPERYGLAGNKTRYAIDLDSQEVVIKVIDPGTQEELRQIPSPEARKLAKQIEAYQKQAFNL